jgi:hypothetical protein
MPPRAAPPRAALALLGLLALGPFGACAPHRAPDPRPARHAPTPRPPAAAAVQAVAPTLDPAALDAALRAHACAQAQGRVAPVADQPLLAIIDYGRPSRDPRLWVVDLRGPALVWHDLVSHGEATGDDDATAFSDTPDSHQTSLGAFATAETYTGRHGLSLRLDGLEPGLNGNARARDIVVHGADYVDEAHVAEHGRLGRSWGCPAVRRSLAADLVPHLAGGALLFAWHPAAVPAPGSVLCGGG